MENSINWAHLPQEILGKIFSFFTIFDRTLTLSLVCKNWAEVCYDPLLNTSYMINGDKQSQDEILQNLRSAPNLKYLWIVNRNDLNMFLKEVGKYNKKLKLLKIKKCFGSIKNQKTISSLILLSLLTKCKMIEQLSIKHTPIRSKKLFVRLGNMIPNLKKIALTTDLDVTDISLIVKGCPNLQSISLLMPYTSSIKDESIKEICQEIGKRLTTLKVTASLLTDTSIFHLLQKCMYLKTLHLIQPKTLTETGITKLAQFLHLTSLAVTEIHVEWLEINFFREWCAKLRILNLSGCNIGDEVLLKISLYCNSLEKLNISRCHAFTHLGLSNIFKYCIKLTQLNIYLTPYALMKELHPTLSQLKVQKLRRLIYRPCDSVFWDILYNSMRNKIQQCHPDLQILSSIDEEQFIRVG